MAISRESFDRGDFNSKNESNDLQGHPIMKFLRKQHRNAFTAKEIADQVGLTDSGVRSMLRKLAREGLVTHKSPYFIAKVNSKKKTKKKKKK